MNIQFDIGKRRLAITLLLLCAVLCTSVRAATPAGTIIRNQASAVYKDDTGREYTVISNVVETLIEQVVGMELVQDQQQVVAPGSSISFSHRLSNTGNGDDRFNLQVLNESGDNIDLGDLAIYADLDQDGLPDNNIAITTTPWIAADSDFYFVISGKVPTNAVNGDAANITIRAISQFTSTIEKSNSDTAKVDTGAVMVFAKSISSSAGISPSGPYTVTLKYKNTGSVVANQVTLIDALPQGMVYVSDSGRWSLNPQSLTDADPSDVHIGGSTSIRYCAYHNSCVDLAEAQLDQDASSINQVTAIIETVQAGETGSLSFDVEIAELLPAGVLINQAEMLFDSGGATRPIVFSNAVSFSVLQNAGVVANGSQATAIDGMSEPVTVSSAPLAGTVSFNNIIWNTGNSVDTFNIEVDTNSTTFPASTVYRLLKADATTPLLDNNQDGVVDTGPLEPGQFAIVVMQLQLPFGVSGNNNGAGFDIRKVARSANDANVFNDITDHLDEIVSNQVDLTNQSPAGSAGALGVGPGPENLPVSTVTVDETGQATFDLYVRHQGSFAGSYDLSGHATANGGALPAGWQVIFTDGISGAVVTNTGVLDSGESRHFIARLSVPATPEFTVQSVFFKVVSPLNGASDIKHDAVQFAKKAQLKLTPSLSAQVNPGGSVVYEHLITNSGNVMLSDIVFDLQQSNSQWQATLYADTDMNGFLSPDDLIISAPMSLQPGASADIFVKVFAPSAAVLGQSNISMLGAASASGNTNSSITDVTTVSESQVSIRKEQAVDVGCDGQPDPGTDFTPAQINVAPGNNCVIYRLTAINNGTQTSYNVVIRDYTPPYTLYYPAAVCSRTPCWINEPDAEQTGTINAETDQLLPGDAYFLQFSVRVQ